MGISFPTPQCSVDSWFDHPFNSVVPRLCLHPGVFRLVLCSWMKAENKRPIDLSPVHRLVKETCSWQHLGNNQWTSILSLSHLWRVAIFVTRLHDKQLHSVLLFYFRSPHGNHSTVRDWVSVYWLHLDQRLSHYFRTFSNGVEVGSKHNYNQNSVIYVSRKTNKWTSALWLGGCIPRQGLARKGESLGPSWKP